MAKDTRLINIYLKIHHKQSLSMDDLSYLAEYDPECFEKTCQNVVYNIPEAEPIIDPFVEEKKTKKKRRDFFSRKNIERILENLKKLEISDFPLPNIDAAKLKSLLGNLYMELLFPHNDKKDNFMDVSDTKKNSSFDRRV